MIISCTTCALRGYGRDEIWETLKYAPKAGYSYWGLAGPITWTPGLIRWLNTDLLNRLAAEAGLKGCTEVYGPSIPTDSVKVAERGAEDVFLVFEAAIKINSPLVVITGGRRRKGGLACTIAGLKKLCGMIVGMPVKLALEPHIGSQIQEVSDYKEIFKHVTTRQVGITIDTGHFHLAGVDWKAVIRQYSDRIYNVHVKDHIGRQSVPLGTGEIDLPGLVKELHAINYRGALAIELEVNDPENLPRYVSEAYRYMRDLVNALPKNTKNHENIETAKR